MKRSKLQVLSNYVVIGVLSAAINLSAQVLIIWAYKGAYAVEFSILIGTVMGMPPRYFLEKRYVFSFTSENIFHDGKLFFQYSFYSTFTTLVFWSVEYSFHVIFNDDLMRYVGGVVGLTIGFYLKYQIDKRFVFRSVMDER
jgi:putative flippase GtrA